MSSIDRRPPEPVPDSDPRARAFARLLGIVDRLRAPDGCPWDREQSVESMAAFVIEEGHELVEAIERGQDEAAAEEAGDLLMVVAMICRIAEEAGRFDLARAGAEVCDKLVRRHPHVFGDVEAGTSGEVLANWEAIKQAEREDKRVDASAVAGVPASLPALQRVARTGEKAISAGFRWSSARGALEKVAEELEELRAALDGAGLDAPGEPELGDAQRARAEEELGDLLLAGAFLGSYLGIDPERACRASLRRFEARFRSMEAALGGALRERPLEELLAAWRRAKAAVG